MKRVAAVDCGTNTIRLLIADLDPGTGDQDDVERRTHIVRLGQGVDRTGEFAAEALRRTFAVSDEYAALIRSTGVDSLRVIGTSASRDARNGDELRTGMARRFGREIEILSGDEEARLAYDGAVRGVAGHDRAELPQLVVDVGGGSTEFVLGRDRAVVGQSLDIGSVRLTERHLATDPPTDDEVASCVETIDSAIGSLRVPLEAAASVVGVAGTVTTIAAMVAGLDTYDSRVTHGAWMERDELSSAIDRLVAMTIAERRGLGFMAPGRADVIGAGALIVARVMAHVDVPGMLASESDILDGIAWSQT